MEIGQEISEDFYRGRGIDIAEELIGKFLVNEENSSGGVIVETEAYLGKEDPSCHFAKSGEARKKIFRKGAGTVYVYMIHGHNCMNFISEYRGEPEGILIRAVEPVRNVEGIKKRRGREDKLLSGPGRLTEGLDISKEKHNGQRLKESPISLYETGRDPEVATGRRIGIKNAEDWPCRFVAKGSSHISKPLKQGDSSFDYDEFYSNLGSRS